MKEQYPRSLSASRYIIVLLGAELGNGMENSYVPPLEITGSRNASIPVVTAAIVPSPTLLWRFKTTMVWLWGINLLVFLGLISIMRKNFISIKIISPMVKYGS